MPARMVADLSDLLWEKFPKIMGELERGLERPCLEDTYKIPLVKSDVHGNSTMKLDSTRIDETGTIIERLLGTTGFQAPAFKKRSILNARDLGTHLKASSL